MQSPLEPPFTSFTDKLLTNLEKSLCVMGKTSSNASSLGSFSNKRSRSSRPVLLGNGLLVGILMQDHTHLPLQLQASEILKGWRGSYNAVAPTALFRDYIMIFVLRRKLLKTETKVNTLFLQNNKKIVLSWKRST